MTTKIKLNPEFKTTLQIKVSSKMENEGQPQKETTSQMKMTLIKAKAWLTGIYSQKSTIP